MKHIFLSILFIGVAIPTLVSAGPVLRTGETVSVDGSQTVEGDFYGFGGVVTLSGEARADAYLGGGTITVNAPVQTDLTILGGSVQVHGMVGDDLRIVGGDITIADTVKGDVLVLGGLVSILSTATIEGDLLFFGGEAIVDGKVTGSINGTADRVRINGVVGGDVALVVPSRITLGDNADITGGVTYESRNDILRSQNARIGGDVRKISMVPEVGRAFFETYLFLLCMVLFTCLSFYFMVRVKLLRFVETTTENIPLTGLIGLGMFLTIPFVASVLLISIIGSILGGIMFLAYGLLLVLGYILGAIVLGFLIEKYVFRKQTLTLTGVALGVVIFTILPEVPFIGGLLVFALTIIALGGLGILCYRSARG